MFRTPDFLQDVPLFKRLIPSLSKRYAKWFKPRFMVEHRHGVDLLLDQHNLVDRIILTRGYWEKKQFDYLLPIAKKLKKGQGSLLFLDIGSHCGLYSIVMKKNFPDIDVIAFEPEAVNYTQLQANLLINDMLDGIKVHRIALSDHEGDIYLSRPVHNRGVTQVTEEGNIDPSRDAVIEKVRCAPLDNLLKIHNSIVAAKIDVEGHEISVLNGMTRLLQQNRFFLQIESFSGNFPVLKEAMAKLGYVYLKTIDHDHYFTNHADMMK